MSDPLRAGGGITARGDAVRCPLMLVLVYILIPNSLSSFVFLCARSGRAAAPVLPRAISKAATEKRKVSNGPGDVVRCPFIFILFSFLFDFLMPFPPSFCLGRNPILPPQVSFGVRPDGGVHPRAGSVLLQDLRLAGGVPVGSITRDL